MDKINALKYAKGNVEANIFFFYILLIFFKFTGFIKVIYNSINYIN